MVVFQWRAPQNCFSAYFGGELPQIVHQFVKYAFICMGACVIFEFVVPFSVLFVVNSLVIRALRRWVFIFIYTLYIYHIPNPMYLSCNVS